MNTYRKVLFSFLAITTLALSPAQREEEVISFDSTTRNAIENFEKKNPYPDSELFDVLKKIAWCESRNRQFNLDGTILRGEINPQDVGKYQINEHYHLEDSQRLGMDIYTLAGNTEYAKYLYSKQGSKPWNWSKKCWGDSKRAWTEKAGEYWSK